jgi:hypothetical protein
MTSCAPTPETANLITAKAGVKLKLQALKESGRDFKDLSPDLAAVILGVPLVASVPVVTIPAAAHQKPHEKSWFEKIFGEAPEETEEQ